MKKIYKRPIAENVVLNLGEPVAAWGDLANKSNTGIFTGGKDTDTVWEETDEEEKTEAGIPTLRNSVWDEDMEKHIKPSNIFK